MSAFDVFMSGWTRRGGYNGSQTRSNGYTISRGVDEFRERRAGWSEQRMNWRQCLEVVIYEGERGIRMEPVGCSRTGPRRTISLSIPLIPRHHPMSTMGPNR